MSDRIESFRDFFPYYLREHSAPACRALHYVGTVLGTAAFVVFLVTLDWRFLVAYPVLGYGFAWASHAFIERNRPATFTYPVWSLMGDYRMLWLWATGRLKPHLDAALKAA